MTTRSLYFFLWTLVICSRHDHHVLYQPSLWRIYPRPHVIGVPSLLVDYVGFYIRWVQHTAHETYARGNQSLCYMQNLTSAAYMA